MNNLQRLTNLPIETLTALFNEHGSKTKVLRALGIAEQDGRARRILRDRLGALATPRVPLSHSKEAIQAAFSKAECWSDVYRALALSCCDHNKKAVIRAAKSYKIEVPTFNVKKTFQRGKPGPTSPSEIFVENSTYLRGSLRSAVQRFNILGECRCSKCGIGEVWQGEPLTIELDHINGISNDNRPENLRWLCPNCHSQTGTYKGKNLSTPSSSGCVAKR